MAVTSPNDTQIIALRSRKITTLGPHHTMLTGLMLILVADQQCLSTVLGIAKIRELLEFKLFQLVHQDPVRRFGQRKQ